MPDPNPLADAIAAIVPDAVLNHPAATGAGVRVAVLDTGVDPASVPLAGAARFPGATAAGAPSGPHGTTVAHILHTLAPRAELYSADVFAPGLGGDVDAVVAAIRHAMDVWKVHIINLSLGVPEAKLGPAGQRQKLQRAVEEAYFRDVLVFAAAHNDHPLFRSFPASDSPPLFSVDKGAFPDGLHFAYALRERIEFAAQSRGYIGPFAKEPATSWATPHLAGAAARLLSLSPGLKPFEVKTVLYWLGRAA
jgi:subtilisin